MTEACCRNESTRVPMKGRYRHPALHRQGEGARIALKIGGHVGLAGQRVRGTGKLQAWQRVVAHRREESQRFPSALPCGADLVVRIEDRETQARPCQVITGREAGLAGADHDRVVMEVRHRVLSVIPPLSVRRNVSSWPSSFLLRRSGCSSVR